MSRPDLAAAILQGWEDGLALHAVARPLALLSRAQGVPFATLAALTCGERDAHLLALREQALGAAFECEASCPRCGERLEFSVSAEELRQPHGEASRNYEAQLGMRPIRFRLPTTADLVAIASVAGTAERERELAARCVEDAARLDADEIASLGERMAQADPQGDVNIGLRCPGCGHAWDAAFDVAAYVWAEMERLALRLLDQVHILAVSYGWTQDEVFALSPTRRQYYLDRCIA